MELVHLWGQWFQGTSVAPAELWFMKVLWWARLGKVMQLVAGLSILLDVAGPVRLHNFGVAFDAATKQFLTRSKGVLKWAWPRVWKFIQWNKAWRLLAVLIAATVLCYAIGALLAVQELKEKGMEYMLQSPPRLPTRIALLLTIGFAVGGGLVLLALTLPTLLIVLASWVVVSSWLQQLLFVRPMHWVLTHPAALNILRVTAAFLLVVGFHFDLLGS